MSDLQIDGWDESTLGELISDSQAGEWGAEAKGDEDDIPVLRSTNFTASGVVDYSKLALRNIEKKKRVKKSLKIGDIVLEKSGGSPAQPVGRVVYFDLEAPYLYSNFTQKMTPSQENDSKFVFYKFFSEYEKGTVKKFQQQTTGIINFQLNEYFLYKTCIPPLPEQKKIAAILSSVDDVIEKTQAQIDKLNDLKTGMMQELLTKGIGPDGKPHTEFKDSPVGRIPVGWEVAEVNAISDVVDSMHLTPKFSERGKPMVRVTEIRNSETLDISSALLVDDKTFKNFTRNYVPKLGDILIARVGAYFGAMAYIKKESDFCLGQNTASIRPKNIEPGYLFEQLNSRVVRSQLEDSVAVGAQPSISLASIKKLKVPIAPREEQLMIFKAIDAARNKRNSALQKLEAKKKIKKALMQDLLTGKVRVNPVDIEEAVAS